MAPRERDEPPAESPSGRRDFSLSALQVAAVVAAWVGLALVWGSGSPSFQARFGVVAVILAILTVLFLFIAAEKARWHAMEQRRVAYRRESRGLSEPPEDVSGNVKAGHRRALAGAVGRGLIRLAMLAALVYGLRIFGRLADLRPGHTIFLCAVGILAFVVLWELARWRRMERERVEGRRRARGIVRWPRLRSRRRAVATPTAACVPAATRRRRMTEHGQWKGIVALVLIVIGCLATVLAVLLSFAQR